MLFVLNTTNIAEKKSRTWVRRGVFADKWENIINVSYLNYNNFTEKKIIQELKNVKIALTVYLLLEYNFCLCSIFDMQDLKKMEKVLTAYQLLG